MCAGAISAVCAVEGRPDQELVGNGYLRSSRIKRKCTKPTLITSSVGGGPLYDITIENPLTDSQLELLNDINNEPQAHIEYDSELPIAINLGEIGSEELFISPSNFDPNYNKVKNLNYKFANVDRITSDDRYPEKRYENRRLSKISKDGSTLVVVKPVYGSDEGFTDNIYERRYIYQDCEITIFKKVEGWQAVKTLYCRTSLGLNATLFDFGHDAIQFGNAKCLDVNDDGTVIVVGSPYAYGNSSSGFCVIFTYNETEDSWHREHLCNGIDSSFKPGNSVSIDGDGNTLVIGAISEYSSAQGIVYICKRNIDGNFGRPIGDNLRNFFSVDTTATISTSDYSQLSSYSKSAVFGSLVCISQDGQRLAVYRPVGYNSPYKENVLAHINIYNYEDGNWVLEKELETFTHRNNTKYTSWFQSVDRTDVIDLSMSQDGSCVLFGATDPYIDSTNTNDRFNGRLRVWKHLDNQWVSQDIYSDPAFPSIDGYHDNLDKIRIGLFVDLSSNGERFLVGKEKSACVYDYQHIGYGDYSWTKVSEIFPQDRVADSLGDHKYNVNGETGHYLVTGSIDGDGELVELLSFTNNRSIVEVPRNNAFNFLTHDIAESHLQDNHAIYSIDSSKSIDKLNFDELGSVYLDWNGPVISKLDDDGYKYIYSKPFDGFINSSTIRSSLVNSSSEFSVALFSKATNGKIIEQRNNNTPSFNLTMDNATYIRVNYRSSSSALFSNLKTKYINVVGLLRQGWNHHALIFDKVKNSVSYYLNGSLIEKFYDNLMFINSQESYYFNIYPNEGMDDVRYFSRLLSESEICRLSQHRVPSICPQHLYYDFLGQKDGVVSLEYVSGTYLDFPIDQLCQKTVIDDCGNTDCVIDAEIEFCYYQDLPFINPIFGVTASGMSGVGFVESNSPPHLQIEQAHDKEVLGTGTIFSTSHYSHGFTQDYVGSGELTTGFVDKYNGEFYDFACVQKLYPSGNVDVSDFFTKDNSIPHYENINEGVFTGDWMVDSELVSDDEDTFMQLIAPDTKGEFFCKLGMSKPLIEPEKTVLRMRLSAPLTTNDSKLSPRYTIKNIRFEDPNGDLVVRYDDIVFMGDSDFQNDINYTTVVRTSNKNTVIEKHKWDAGYPDLESNVGYNLSFDIVAEDRGGEFTTGYDQSFAEDQKGFSAFNNSLRISAIEICNSGRSCVYDENYVTMFTQVTDTGRRLEKCFLPTMFPHYTYDSGIWPSVSSIWSTNSYTNETPIGQVELVEALRDRNPEKYITLDSMGPVENSGKLTLRFGYSVASEQEVSLGAFNGAFNQSVDNIWFTPSGAFNTLNKVDDEIDRNFFNIDTVTLKVLAKKAVGSRDYVLDVVGYSDDCLLNVTTATSGFLQNTSGVFISDPVADTTTFLGNDGDLSVMSSGFRGVDELGMSFESMSDEDQYFEKVSDITRGGDHYLLATYPVVDSTDFQWYEIPLQIYEDKVEIGRSRDYKISTMLERLYLDIYPLPTGASIASAYICVRYNPQNAVKLSTQGGEQLIRLDDGRSEGGFYPTSRQSSSDIVINAGSGYGPISKIENIPHAFGTPSGIKSNYSRRWRGMEGTYVSPFNTAFNFGYTKTLLDYPFISGFYIFEDKSTTITPVVGNLTGTLNTSLTDYHFSHYGWRFLDNNIFTSKLPGYTSSYKTTDWTALSNGALNFEGHDLYGQISDAFKNIIRIEGHNSYVDFGDIDYGSNGGNGLSIYVRFTPDVDATGATYNLFESGVLVSKWDSASDLEFAVAYSGGYIAAFAKDSVGAIHEVVDTVPYTEYQFPLSVIMTYNDEGDNKLKLYTDNEFESGWNVLRASSDSFAINTNASTLKLGNSPGSGVGFNMFVSEFGVSSGNIVENETTTPLKVTAQKFLENNRVYWWDNSDNPSSDAYKLWSNLDEDTYNDWYLGAFTRCAFNFEFDNLNSIKGKTAGVDLVNFTINHHGSGYSQYAQIDMPQSVDSGVAYHTQIENDFLRFHLSDTADNFYSTYPRIRKSLPDSYDFTEKALVVETILEHKTDTNNIAWEDGSIGPKLIVSLYTKTKEPEFLKRFVSEFSEPNWGLVNRDIHYLEPSTCLIRVDSKFTYDSYCDKSEKWALFPYNARLSEFKEKFYSTDVDDMFLQYDLVYPSGPAFHSRIDMFSAHVRAEDAFINPTDVSGQMTLTTSGNPSPVSGTLNLNLLSASGLEPGSSLLYPNLSGITLMTLGPLKIQDSGFILVTSGEQLRTERIPLMVVGKETVSDSGFYLVASGDSREWSSTSAGGFTAGAYQEGVVGQGNNPPLSLVTHGKGLLNINMPLLMNLNEVGTPASGFNLPLFTFAPSGEDFIAMRETSPMFLMQDSQSDKFGSSSGVVSLVSAGRKSFVSPYTSSSMGLFTVAPSILREALTLTIYSNNLPGDSFTLTDSTQNLQLFLANYFDQSATRLMWYNDNYGTDIDFEDNVYASIPADDEIRGVDLFGYGSCTGDSPKKAIDPPLITDDITWRPETCNEGGIFRATSTYTNLDVGYSGDYYGIRKYTGLTPSAPYFVTMKIATGNTAPIPVPRDWEEWEYGICGPDTIGDCCPDDCTQNIKYSGVKLLGDFPYVTGNEDLTQVESRQQSNEYGRTVSVKEDLMAVGSPYHALKDEQGVDIENAGAVFLYRRDTDIPGLKANWLFEDKLTLPSGYRRDYIRNTYQNLLCYPNRGNPEFCVSGQKWSIGQEGREFGYSLDIGRNSERETVVVGAPGAAWSRTFDDIVVSGIPALMVVFTDKFSYNKNKMAAIHNTAAKYERLYKYFTAPWNFGDGDFQPRIDVNVLVCQIIDSDQRDSALPVRPSEPWFHHMYIDNLLDVNNSYDYLVNHVSSGIQNKFKEIFPHTNAHIYSGIAPIVGIFGDDTPSTSNKAAYEGALDRFLDFYQKYAYASGVENLEESTAQSGYINQIFSDSFVWNEASVEIMDKTLATGNLAQNDALIYLTSGVGQEWAKSNAYEFQIPPESGGRVFIFENEGGAFNLVQEIVSPDENLIEQENRVNGDDPASLFYGNRLNDRFGHSVSISENSDVISIGSPYSIEPCLIYERDEKENERLYSKVGQWLDLRLPEKKARYNTLLAASGALAAGKQIYLELDHPNKFFIRTDELFWGLTPINLYKKVFKYDYRDIDYVGTWSFLPAEFAGTSRLGFSTAVSESGNIVAFGAPTDSFNEFDDFNVWGESEDTWASYAQAGAVRVFESREYINHNKVVEFTRFGNLDRNTNGPHISYESMGDYFSPLGVPFEKLPFSEIEIPKDAGLAFIITPELDAASDEIIDNIKTWLSYGDRTLVLVGNDPIWEQNGLYEKSNNIINKILEKLDSRMRIVPARNKYESLAAGVTEEQYNEDRYNITRAHRPKYGHNVYVTSPNMFASGVGDIRIDLSKDNLTKLKIYSPCDDKNSRCELPIEHLGDLRAEWDSECVVLPNGGVEYKTNWPFHFDNPNPAQSCSFYPEIVKPELANKEYQDIVPVLTAAEYKSRPPVIIPAQSGTEEQCTTELSGIITTVIRRDSKTYDFADNQIDDLEFALVQTTNPVTLSGTFNLFERGQYFDPDAFKNRNSFMQAEGTPYNVDAPPKTVVVSPESVWATEETYFSDNIETTSKVILMASMQAETDFSLGKSSDPINDPNNKDQNIYFYNNLVMKDCNNASNINQLGGWTGRDSFTDAFAESKVVKVLQQGGHAISSGVVYTSDIPATVDVLWIANPAAKPQDSDVARIKKWMKQGDKKIILTYSPDQEIANHVEYICDELSLKSKPYYSQGNNAYFVKDSNKIADSNSQEIPYQQGLEIAQKIDSDANAFKGCAVGYGFNRISANTKVEKLAICPTFANPLDGYRISEYNMETGLTDYAYIPIKVGANTRKLVYYLDPLTEKRYENPYTFWKIDANSTMKFPVTPGSGYRMFVNWVSETKDEKFDIAINVDGVSFSPEPGGEGSQFIEEGGNRKLNKTVVNEPRVSKFDFRVPDNKEEFTVTFNTNEWRTIKSEDFDGGRPLTPRILSISGCLLPIEVTTHTYETTKSKKVYVTKCSGVPWYVPEKVITYPELFRPISTSNDKYCQPNSEICDGFNGQDIEDGPVVVADEMEHFTNFSRGRQRSRIILISDSSMIQGNNSFRDNALEENQDFIRSLYPTSPDKVYRDSSPDSFLQEGTKKFEFTQKLRAPERGSAAKYYAATGIAGQTVRYTLGGVAGSLENYTDQEDTLNPSDVTRRYTPETIQKIEQEIENFYDNSIVKYGMYPRYSGMIDGKLYVDANIAGGMPEFMKAYGKDYIDFDMLASGYAGDLFGYSIDIHEDKLIVGAPFNAFRSQTPISWSGIKGAYDASDVGSGLQVSAQGGAGAAFYFERTGRGVSAVSEFLPWGFKEKLKPESINVGIDNASIADLEEQKAHKTVNLTSQFVLENAAIPDRFGHSVTIDSDFAAIGAPMHDFETIHQHIYEGDSAFIRKEFGSEFAIPKHSYYDLGSSGIRIDEFERNSGNMVLNNGAVFTFRHQMVSFAERRKDWIFAEKLNAQGYSDRNTDLSSVTGCENDHFGFSVAIDRAYRGDSDYTLVAGSPRHDYATSGDHPTSTLTDAGSVYTFDAMLREQLPTIPVQGNIIDAQVFGLKPDKKEDMLDLSVTQNITGKSLTYEVSGIIYSNPSGYVFLEVSGKDPAAKGFVAHRPYVVSVTGEILDGTGVNNSLNLVTKGRGIYIDNAWPDLVGGLDLNSDYTFDRFNFNSDFDSAKIRPSGMSLYIVAPDQADVYNNMNLYTTSWTKAQEGSGLGATPFFLNVSGAEPFDSSGVATLFTSGIGIFSAGSGSNPLTLRVRGV